MRNNAAECVNQIVKQLKDEGLQIKKSLESKRKILESEVTQAAVAGVEIDKLLANISEWEVKVTQ